MRISKSLNDINTLLIEKEVNINGVEYKKICNLDLIGTKPLRAGVIPFYKKNNEIYFILGIDSKTHELTDFAGSVKYKIENCIEGALREFKEESLIFKKLNKSKIENFHCIYDEENLIIFIGYNLDFEEISKKFLEKYHMNEFPEVCGLIRLNHLTFQEHIKNGKNMFSRLKNFLYKAKFYETKNMEIVI